MCVEDYSVPQKEQDIAWDGHEAGGVALPRHIMGSSLLAGPSWPETVFSSLLFCRPLMIDDCDEVVCWRGVGKSGKVEKVEKVKKRWNCFRLPIREDKPSYPSAFPTLTLGGFEFGSGLYRVLVRDRIGLFSDGVVPDNTWDHHSKSCFSLWFVWSLLFCFLLSENNQTPSSTSDTRNTLSIDLAHYYWYSTPGLR